MTRPNFIPRTRIGANGERLFDIPGVYYPREMLAPGDGGAAVKPRVHDYPRPGYMSSAAAVKLLRVSVPSSARYILHQHRCPHIFVKRKGGPPLIYWRAQNVRAIAAKAPPVDSPPPGYVSTKEAIAIVGCRRSVLQRGVDKGHVRSVTLRVPSLHRRGFAVRSFFCAADLPAFKERHAFFVSARQAALQPPLRLPAP